MLAVLTFIIVAFIAVLEVVRIASNIMRMEESQKINEELMKALEAQDAEITSIKLKK